MNNKDKTIQACRNLADKYRKPQGLRFFKTRYCDLCKIHNKVFQNCSGCPLATEVGDMGCVKFKTYKAAHVRLASFSTSRILIDPHPKTRKSWKEFIDRAEFFDKIIPILEKIPATRFTKSGWIYFKEISRDL